jgi:hypothetical protein
MSASLCYWVGITCGVFALMLVVMGCLIHWSCAPEPSEADKAARLQEWTVDERELGDWTFPDSQASS